MTNTEELKPSIIINLITDLFLLVTVLVGLLLSDGSHSFGLGRLIWKQVGSEWYPFAAPQSTDMFPVLKGIIWLLIATATGIPPTASSASFLALLLTHRCVNVAGIHCFEFGWYCYSLSGISMKDIELNMNLGISSIQPRTFLFITS